ncbi:MAG TPA: methyltransferase domain-containing protein [Anaerolineales bacterium]|jgi:ubiquinone/menaquinone biosynthesis C-methylase UbiE|nr:methyltransferase domain-containing protein [Anaerolineales bacterium]
MSDTSQEYIPALSFKVLTPFYDFIQRWIVRDVRYKSLLIEQAAIQPGQRVLDLGCGTGTLAMMAKQAQPNAEVFGLDADPDMLKVANYKKNQSKLDVKFDVGFTNELPYPDAHFDRILSSIMIHHLKTPDKEKTAREVYRVLKPGGQLHIIDFGKPNTFYGKLLGPFLHNFEEANDNIEGRLPEIFGAPGLKTQITGHFWTFFGDLAFLRGDKPAK